MPAYRFSWDAFNDKFVYEIACAAGEVTKYESVAAAREWLAKNIKNPSREFVLQHREVLQKHWLPDYAGLDDLVDQLMKKRCGGMEGNVTPSRRLKYIASCRGPKTFGGILLEAFHRFGKLDRKPDDDGSIGPVVVLPARSLVCKAQPVDERRPHDYQKSAWKALDAHLAEYRSTKLFQGLLVMPTGSGKTYTAVRWLLENLVAEGYRVLWIAHRHELLEQTALAVYRSARVCADRLERLRVRIVSGQHSKAVQIGLEDDFLICSVGSVTRKGGLIPKILADPKTIMVIDEAHHSSANSYKTLINELGKPKKKMILGLTATPYRSNESDQRTLSALFNSNVIHEVPIRNLIDKGFLSRPIPVVWKTGTDVEVGITAADRAHERKFKDLSSGWFDRIAVMTKRNAVIADHYAKNKDKYGKTVIFAISIQHAVLLSDELRRLGLRANYVASGRAAGAKEEGEPQGNKEIIESFRKGDLDVLVNVQILTEGVDVPSIQTVFLTRPTKSAVMLRQMIGRALRGTKAGGTADAYIVSFEDQWREFGDWQSPLSLVADIVGIPEREDAGGEKDKSPAKFAQLVEGLPWETIRELAAGISRSGAGFEADAFEAVPAGCYAVTHIEGDDEIRHTVSVYEHQLPCWNEFLAKTAKLPAARRSTLAVREVFKSYFEDCDVPRVSEYDVAVIVDHYKNGGDPPEFFGIPGRDFCDPYKVAEVIHDGDMGEKRRNQLMSERYSDLAKVIYPSLRQFQSAINDALFELTNPAESTRAHKAVPIFDPRPDQMMLPGPHHDLPKLMAKLRKMAPAILGETKFPEVACKLSWTTRVMKGWYGIAHLEHGTIRINKLLDSPDVSESVMLFLLWHEWLHLYLDDGHSPKFRKLEQAWRTYVDDDRWLSNLEEKFGVQWW